MAVLVVIAHYLNGGIRVQSGAPSVAPQVKVHISVLLAGMALVKAFGYILARYNLDLSQNGYVQGATYTDVHARLPALTLLFWISLLAAVILLINIRRRGWALPVLGVGLWAFVAIVVGAIYPAIVQAVKVNPAQNTLEKPYIARNIAATRAAMGINNVTQASFKANQSLTPVRGGRQRRHPEQRPAVGPHPDGSHLHEAAGHAVLLLLQHPGHRPLRRSTASPCPWWSASAR